MTSIITYKGVAINYSSLTGMAWATVMVNWPVFDTDEKTYGLQPKEEKLHGRLKNVKQWIDKGIKEKMLIIHP